MIIFHMVDLATRFSAAKLVKDKEPRSIIEAYSAIWLSIFGPPFRIWNDNGGEFYNSKLVELLERFGSEIKTTPRGSPFSAGIVEKKNAYMKTILDKVASDVMNKDTDVSTLLNFTEFAMNTLQDHQGFSSHQSCFWE